MVMSLKLKTFLILFFKLISHNKEEDLLEEHKEHIILIDKLKTINRIITCNYWFYYPY